MLFDPTTTLLLQRGIRRGLLTLRRERGFGTSLLALLGVALLLQIFIIAGFAAYGLDSVVRAGAEVPLQISVSATDADVQQFIVGLRELASVSDVTYITRERAFAAASAADPASPALNGANPFHDTLIVKLSDFSRFNEFSAYVHAPGASRIVDLASFSSMNAKEAELQQTLSFTALGRTASLLFLGLAGGILFLVVAELVRRRALLRRDEVFVERMSGAREASVVVPFATEASVLLLVALLLGVACAAGLVWSLSALTPILSGGVLEVLRTEMLRLLTHAAPMLVILQILAVPAVGFAGAYLGTRGR